MRTARVWTRIGMPVAALGLILGTSAQAQAAADHWDPGLRENESDHWRDTPVLSVYGATGAARVFWDDNYHLSVHGTVTDTEADGAGAAVEVKYDYDDGSGWKTTQRWLVKAPGGRYDHQEADAHSKAGIRVAYLKVQACTVKSGVKVSCSGWK